MYVEGLARLYDQYQAVLAIPTNHATPEQIRAKLDATTALPALEAVLFPPDDPED